MTRLIVIGTRKTGSSLALVRAALNRNWNVTVTGGPREDLQGVFPDCVDIANIEADADVVVGWIRGHYPDADRALHVTTSNDAYASLAATVAQALGLPGPNASSVVRFASKDNQKALLASHGLPTAEFVVGALSDLPAILMQLESMRFPAVVKPVEGTAGQGVKRCLNFGDAKVHLEALFDDARSKARLGQADGVIVETFLDGNEYCVEYFDGHYVGALRKLKRYGEHFLERGYTSELDLDGQSLQQLIDCGAQAIEQAGLTWGPVHLDCIISNGLPHVIEINPRIAGSFIPDIVRDAYGFSLIDSLLDKLQGHRVALPPLFAPRAYARVDFLLDNDPLPWDFREPGELKNGHLHVTYGPQCLPSRQRRAYLYVRNAFQPETERTTYEKAID